MPSNCTISMRKSNCSTKAISPPWKINSNTIKLTLSSCSSKYQPCNRKDQPFKSKFHPCNSKYQPPNNKFIILQTIKTSFRKKSLTINHLSLQPINKSPLSSINCIKSTPKSLPINNLKPPSLTNSPKRTLSFTPFKLRHHTQRNSSNCSANNIPEPKPKTSNYPPNSSSTNRPSSNSTGTLSPLGKNFNSPPKRGTLSTENSPKPSINSPIPLSSSPKPLNSSPKPQPNFSPSRTNLSHPKIPVSIK